MVTARCTSKMLCVLLLCSLLVSSEAFFNGQVGKRSVKFERTLQDVCQFALDNCGDLASQQKSRDAEMSNERPEKRQIEAQMEVHRCPDKGSKCRTCVETSAIVQKRVDCQESEQYAVINTEQSRNSLLGEHSPKYLGVRSKDTKKARRRCRERRFPRYLNDYVAS